MQNLILKHTFAGQEANDRSNEIRFEHVNHFLWPDGLCHGRAGRWSHHVGQDAVFLSLYRQAFGETNDSSFCGGVLDCESVQSFHRVETTDVCLAKVTVYRKLVDILSMKVRLTNANSGCCSQNSPILLLLEYRPNSLSTLERPSVQKVSVD